MKNFLVGEDGIFRAPRGGRRQLVAFGLMLLASSYVRAGDEKVSNGEGFISYDRASWKLKYQRPASIPFPADNKFSPERELLGKTLFFDPRLSRSKLVSCASCHNPALSWGDGLPKGVGDNMKELGRRTPTLLNMAWAESMFWDGRAETLEEQAPGPMASAAEMNQALEHSVGIVGAVSDYRKMFQAAYPGEAVSSKSIARAIATYERTIVSDAAPFDRWISGDETAISEDAKLGFDLFNAKAACAKCHTGWNFSDNGFHDIGVPGADKGRGATLPLMAMQHAFKTPTLRNASLRAPFMHDGSEADLKSVIDLYNKGGREKRESLAPEVTPLQLSDREITHLLAFLETLTSCDKPVQIPQLPR